MRLLELTKTLDLRLVRGQGGAGDGEGKGRGRQGGGLRIVELTDDTREVAALVKRVREAGDPTGAVLFVARNTGDDRAQSRATEAVERGAGAVLMGKMLDLPGDAALVMGPNVDQALAGRAAAAVFGQPARRLKLIGITGTNGKTTVATLTQYLLRAAGTKCGLIGTVAIDEGGPQGPRPAELTTPGAIALQRHFAAMVQHGCGACTMEVSSHALDQGRVQGLDFAVGVFTNLTQDHLDYHGTMEAYAAAKAKLFDQLTPDGAAVLNLDGPAWRTMGCPGSRIIGTTTLTPGENVGGPTAHEAREMRGVWAGYVRQLTADATGIDVGSIELGDDDGMPVSGTSLRRISLPLIGRHNVSNALQAMVAAATVLDRSPEALLPALADCPPVPGRLEGVRLDPDPLPGRRGQLWWWTMPTRPTLWKTS